MTSSEQYKLIKGKADKTLYLPKITKFRIDKKGKITFGKPRMIDDCCDKHVPYLIQIPSILFKCNYYWNKIVVNSQGELKITGPVNFGIGIEHGGGTPMISHYKISDIS